MSFSVDSLYNIAINFVLKHITLVESLIGFPSLVGEEIFKRFVLQYDVEQNISLLNVFKKFVDAYQNMILEKLNLSKKLMILNEHFETIIVLSRSVTELCVCGCFLGENHELYYHLSDFERLKKLCLYNNCMNDSSMRMLTLRTRMYGVGSKNIESLNLSDNNFTDEIISYLTAFPKLQYLNLSGSKITKKALQTLKTQYNLHQIFDKNEHEEIITEGWAASLVNKWIEYDVLKKEKKEKKRESRFFLKKRISLILEPSHSQVQSSHTSLVFQKLPPERQLHYSVPNKRQKFSISCDQKGIEEDLFSQYK